MILVLESTIITQLGTEEQYGRVPQNQINGYDNNYSPFIGASIYNFGSSDIYSASLQCQYFLTVH